jgi:hypothetical protein
MCCPASADRSPERFVTYLRFNRRNPVTGTERAMRLAIFLLLCGIGLGGCGIVAAPCRIGSGALKAVPIVGHVAAAPTDACADVIDPDSVSQS